MTLLIIDRVYFDDITGWLCTTQRKNIVGLTPTRCDICVVSIRITNRVGRHGEEGVLLFNLHDRNLANLDLELFRVYLEDMFHY